MGAGLSRLLFIGYVLSIFEMEIQTRTYIVTQICVYSFMGWLV